MRRFFTLLLALAFALSARAEGEEQLLRRVAEYVKALGSYDAAVDVRQAIIRRLAATLWRAIATI